MICTEEFGSHEYSEKTCQKCGEDFCFSCCKSTNVHEGGKYEEDYMLCPTCGHNWYENTVDPYRKENKKTNGMELKLEMNGRIFSITIGYKTKWFEQIPFIVIVEEWYDDNRIVEYAEWLGEIKI